MYDYIGPCVLVLDEFLILEGPAWILVLKSPGKLLLPVRHEGGDPGTTRRRQQVGGLHQGCWH